MTTETREQTTQDAVDFEARTPGHSNCEIYWDDSDPGDEGPAYRIRRPWAVGADESGPLDFAGWSSDDDHEDDTYQLSAYFDAGGRYLGPDQHGVHPTFRVRT